MSRQSWNLFFLFFNRKRFIFFLPIFFPLPIIHIIFLSYIAAISNDPLSIWRNLFFIPKATLRQKMQCLVRSSNNRKPIRKQSSVRETRQIDSNANDAEFKIDLLRHYVSCDNPRLTNNCLPCYERSGCRFLRDVWKQKYATMNVGGGVKYLN